MAHGHGQIMVGEPAFHRQGRLTAAAGGHDPLAPLGIGHIAGGKHALDAGFGPAGAQLRHHPGH
jgi:hypothetical protein